MDDIVLFTIDYRPNGPYWAATIREDGTCYFIDKNNKANIQKAGYSSFATWLESSATNVTIIDGDFLNAHKRR